MTVEVRPMFSLLSCCWLVIVILAPVGGLCPRPLILCIFTYINPLAMYYSGLSIHPAHFEHDVWCVQFIVAETARKRFLYRTNKRKQLRSI
jgi:hypothetical protein